LDCGGKRSATPLSRGRKLSIVRSRPARAKAVSPLRSATAVQDARAWVQAVGQFSRLQNLLNRSKTYWRVRKMASIKIKKNTGIEIGQFRYLNFKANEAVWRAKFFQ